MEFPIKFDTVWLGWSIVYNEGTQVIISKYSKTGLKWKPVWSGHSKEDQK